MAGFNTVPGSFDVGAGKVVRRKSDNTGWEGVEIPSVTPIGVYSGTTGSNGRFSVTYATTLSAVPTVIPVIEANSDYNQFVRIVSSTTSGFTVEVAARTGLTVLSLTLLSSATTPVNGAPVNVVVVG